MANNVRGVDYEGEISVTKNGRTCQNWSTSDPHIPNWTVTEEFTKVNNHNFCRNPEVDSGGVWCYTMDPNVRWEYCDVPHCS